MTSQANKQRFYRWREICNKANTWEKKQKIIDSNFFNEVNKWERFSRAFSDTSSTPIDTLQMWRTSVMREQLFLQKFGNDLNFLSYNILKCQQYSRCGLVVDYNVYCLVKDSHNLGIKISCEDFRRFYTLIAIEYSMMDNLLSYNHMSDEKFAVVQTDREVLRDSQYLTYFATDPNKQLDFILRNIQMEIKQTKKLVTKQKVGMETIVQEDISFVLPHLSPLNSEIILKLKLPHVNLPPLSSNIQQIDYLSDSRIPNR
jgi:hypothetical protein